MRRIASVGYAASGVDDRLDGLGGVACELNDARDFLRSKPFGGTLHLMNFSIQLLGGVAEILLRLDVL